MALSKIARVKYWYFNMISQCNAYDQLCDCDLQNILNNFECFKKFDTLFYVS